MSVEQRNSPKLLIGIMGALVTVVVLVLLYQGLNTSSGSQHMQQDEIAAIAATTTTAKKPPDPVPAETPTETKALVSDSLLKVPVPQNAALAKEEVAKLDDIQSQLNEQKATLDAQHQDADQLILLKEEQIKLLESQLAQSH
jgi:hypothetical protein